MGLGSLDNNDNIAVTDVLEFILLILDEVGIELPGLKVSRNGLTLNLGQFLNDLGDIFIDKGDELDLTLLFPGGELPSTIRNILSKKYTTKDASISLKFTSGGDAVEVDIQLGPETIKQFFDVANHLVLLTLLSIHHSAAVLIDEFPNRKREKKGLRNIQELCSTNPRLATLYELLEDVVDVESLKKTFNGEEDLKPKIRNPQTKQLVIQPIFTRKALGGTDGFILNDITDVGYQGVPIASLNEYFSILNANLGFLPSGKTIATLRGIYGLFQVSVSSGRFLDTDLVDPYQITTEEIGNIPSLSVVDDKFVAVGDDEGNTASRQLAFEKALRKAGGDGFKEKEELARTDAIRTPRKGVSETYITSKFLSKGKLADLLKIENVVHGPATRVRQANALDEKKISGTDQLVTDKSEEIVTESQVNNILLKDYDEATTGPIDSIQNGGLQNYLGTIINNLDDVAGVRGQMGAYGQIRQYLTNENEFSKPVSSIIEDFQDDMTILQKQELYLHNDDYNTTYENVVDNLNQAGDRIKSQILPYIETGLSTQSDMLGIDSIASTSAYLLATRTKDSGLSKQLKEDIKDLKKVYNGPSLNGKGSKSKDGRDMSALEIKLRMGVVFQEMLNLNSISAYEAKKRGYFRGEFDASADPADNWEDTVGDVAEKSAEMAADGEGGAYDDEWDATLSAAAVLTLTQEIIDAYNWLIEVVHPQIVIAGAARAPTWTTFDGVTVHTNTWESADGAICGIWHYINRPKPMMAILGCDGSPFACSVQVTEEMSVLYDTYGSVMNKENFWNLTGGRDENYFWDLVNRSVYSNKFFVDTIDDKKQTNEEKLNTLKEDNWTGADYLELWQTMDRVVNLPESSTNAYAAILPDVSEWDPDGMAPRIKSFIDGNLKGIKIGGADAVWYDVNSLSPETFIESMYIIEDLSFEEGVPFWKHIKALGEAENLGSAEAIDGAATGEGVVNLDILSKWENGTSLFRFEDANILGNLRLRKFISQKTEEEEDDVFLMSDVLRGDADNSNILYHKYLEKTLAVYDKLNTDVKFKTDGVLYNINQVMLINELRSLPKSLEGEGFRGRWRGQGRGGVVRRYVEKYIHPNDGYSLIRNELGPQDVDAGGQGGVVIDVRNALGIAMRFTGRSDHEGKLSDRSKRLFCSRTDGRETKTNGQKVRYYLGNPNHFASMTMSDITPLSPYGISKLVKMNSLEWESTGYRGSEDDWWQDVTLSAGNVNNGYIFGRWIISESMYQELKTDTNTILGFNWQDDENAKVILDMQRLIRKSFYVNRHGNIYLGENKYFITNYDKYKTTVGESYYVSELLKNNYLYKINRTLSFYHTLVSAEFIDPNGYWSSNEKKRLNGFYAKDENLELTNLIGELSDDMLVNEYVLMNESNSGYQNVSYDQGGEVDAPVLVTSTFSNKVNFFENKISNFYSSWDKDASVAMIKNTKFPTYWKNRYIPFMNEFTLDEDIRSRDNKIIVGEHNYKLVPVLTNTPCFIMNRSTARDNLVSNYDGELAGEKNNDLYDLPFPACKFLPVDRVNTDKVNGYRHVFETAGIVSKEVNAALKKYNALKDNSKKWIDVTQNSLSISLPNLIRILLLQVTNTVPAKKLTSRDLEYLELSNLFKTSHVSLKNLDKKFDISFVVHDNDVNVDRLERLNKTVEKIENDKEFREQTKYKWQNILGVQEETGKADDDYDTSKEQLAVLAPTLTSTIAPDGQQITVDVVNDEPELVDEIGGDPVFRRVDFAVDLDWVARNPDAIADITPLDKVNDADKLNKLENKVYNALGLNTKLDGKFTEEERKQFEKEYNIKFVEEKLKKRDVSSDYLCSFLTSESYNINKTKQK